MTTPQSDSVPALSAHYKFVQKAYLLCAAALACWRLFGVSLDLSKFGLVFGPAGSAAPSGKRFEQADVAPWILGAGLLYLAYKLAVEWKENDERRRKDKWSRFDFWLTNGLVASALIVTIQQWLFAQQNHLVPLIPHAALRALIAIGGILATTGLFIAALGLVGRLRRGVGIIPFVVVICSAIALLVYTIRLVGPLPALAVLALGLAPLLLVGVVGGVFLLFLAVLPVIGAARVLSGNSEDNPGPSPFDVL